jgi:hypothetical protein
MNIPSRTGVAAGVANGSPRGRLTRRRKVALTGITGLAASVLVPGAALAGNPPSGPGNIEIFAARDMVALEGYVEQAGETATITVKRGDTVIGTGTGKVDSTGFLEFNHPGGSCWSIVTPDIRGGDVVEARFTGWDFVDGAVTGSSVIPKQYDATTGLGVTSEAPPGVTDGADSTFWVKIAGTYDPAQVTSGVINESRFVVEVVNPAMREAPSTIGERAIGWTPVVDPAEPPEPGFVTQGTFGDGKFTAYFGVHSEADRELVLAGEHVALSWMADGTPDLALGATQYEAGETNGPGFGECPAGPGRQEPVAPSTATLTTTDGTDSIKVDWTEATQPADANAIVGYRVSAIDATVTGSHQEVSVEVDGAARSATIVGLKADQPYAIEIEADNGQWSDPSPLGSATPDTDETQGGGGGEQPPPTGAAPTNVTATAPTTTSAEVSWTAAAGATSYEVSATRTGADPVTTTVDAPATTATLTGLTAGSEYSVVVTAVAGDVRTASEPASVTTPTAVAPGAARITRATSAHESIAVEWTAATPGNAASPVTAYDMVATPMGTNGQPSGAAVTASVGTVTTGTIPGLANGTPYRIEVFGKSGDLRGPVSSNGAGVTATVTPNDVVTVGRAEFRANRTEWRVQGTAQDATANSVTIYVWNPNGTRGTRVGTADVLADGSWTFNQRNVNVSPGSNNQIEIVSVSGGRVLTTIARVR